MKVLINNGKSNDDIAKNHFDSEQNEKTRTFGQGVEGIVICEGEYSSFCRYDDGVITRRNNTFTAHPINGKPKKLYKGELQPHDWQVYKNGLIVKENNKLIAYKIKNEIN